MLLASYIDRLLGIVARSVAVRAFGMYCLCHIACGQHNGSQLHVAIVDLARSGSSFGRQAAP